jgi:hypothetical protein
MAIENWFPIDTKASGVNHLDTQSSAPTGADATTGFSTGVNATAGETADMYALTLRPNTAFTAGAKPSTVDPTNGNGFCLGGLRNGTFAAGNWQFDWRPKGSASTTRTCRVAQLLWKSANADGSSGSAIGTVQVSATSAAMTTTAQTLSLTYNPGAITLTNEYLFVLVALESVNATGTLDIFWRLGSLFVFTTPDFSTGDPPVVRPNITLQAVMRSATQ